MKIRNEDIKLDAGVVLNAYPDSIGGTLGDILKFLKKTELENAFQAFYILPSVFNTDLDRGFSVIDYNLNHQYATQNDLAELEKLNIALKFDFVLNHLSVLSKQFQDIIKNGEQSDYKDFFIQWNQFWKGYGKITGRGYVQPDEKYIKDMFFRKPGLPILSVRMPNGNEVPYWNTFYQKVEYKCTDAQELLSNLDIQYTSAQLLADIINAAISQGKSPTEIDFEDFIDYRKDSLNFLESKRQYLGQMDLNIKSPLVWKFYEETLKTLSNYGAQIVRLDAFAYASKEPGLPNFLNDPGTWDLLDRIKKTADRYSLTLLPEIHAKYEDKIHEKLANEGYLTYDFFLPGLIIDAFERNTNEAIIHWIKDIQTKNIKTVNMLGCHDGIPLLDLKGLLTDDQINALIKTVVNRGGFVKDLHSKRNIYYQVNATYYSALGEEDSKLLLARAIQLFMPGKPQVWYLDLLAGTNDYEAIQKAGVGGHKEINRTNFKLNEAIERLDLDVVHNQLSLLKFRNQFNAFGFNAQLTIHDSNYDELYLKWQNKGCMAQLKANLTNYTFEIEARNEKNEIVYSY